MTRAKFESLIGDCLASIEQVILQVLTDAKMAPGDIDDVVLVGGSCRIPKVQQAIRTLFDKDPHRSINPDEVIAHGAALRAAYLAKSHTGWEGSVASLPCDVIKVIDVVPLTLGVAVSGDVMHVIIPRNTPIPDGKTLEKTVSYRTVQDNQTLSRFVIFQGESPVASKNFRLGQVTITNLPPCPKGKICVDLTFSFQPQDGILSVTAVVRDHFELRASLTIEKPQSLSEDEILRLQRGEQAFERARVERRQRDDALAELEGYARKAINNPRGESDAELIPYAEQIVHWCKDNDWAMLPVISLQREELEAKMGV